MVTGDFKHLKVAIAHDVLVETGGAETVLLKLLEIFPQADLYLGLVDPGCDLYQKVKLKIKKAFITSRFQKYSGLLKPLVYLFWEKLDLKDYDLVISSSGSFSAKSVITPPETVHICYCHTPPKYLYKEFAENGKLINLFPILGNILLHFLRVYDFNSAQRPDYIIANSGTTKKRIEKYYRRNSLVIYPPVNIPKSNPFKKRKGEYYLYLGRIYEQKGVRLLAKVFRKLKRKLIIAGTGKDLRVLKANTQTNIEFTGFVDEAEKASLYKNAKAYINASVDEDFGIAPVEAMSYGTPVIAYKSGGLRETVKDNVNGVFFNEYTNVSLEQAIRRFERITFDPRKVYETSKKYASEIFKRKMRVFIVKIVRKNGKI